MAAFILHQCCVGVGNSIRKQKRDKHW